MHISTAHRQADARESEHGIGDLREIRAGRHVDHSVGGLSKPNLRGSVARLASQHENAIALA
jgi:hypothetical protein